ncbi:MAG: UDP-N-acetylmuramoyl-L-alanine--D-glutamate ligase, partial [Lentimicrobiaceae bacterium]
MKQYLCSALLGKKVLILGFGREGQSTLRLLREIMPVEGITISDQNETLVQTHPSIIECNLQTKSGIDYLSGLNDFDVIIKSPGIQLDPDKVSFDPFKITSQTDLFLSVYSKQIVGITGTKGKSTTCSLLYHIINTYSGDALLGGNIGIPLFELIDDIAPGTKIICELSSHQLEYIHTAPHISVLLNLYQEHLDHYKSFYHYQKAKFNIATAQKAGDYFIYAVSDKNIKMLLDEIPVPGIPLPFYDDKLTGNGIGISNDEIILQCENLTKNILPFNFKTNLVGNHNRNNAIIASAVAVLLGVPSEAIEKALITFNPLEHRIEFVGNINGVRYYNDSISTIP